MQKSARQHIQRNKRNEEQCVMQENKGSKKSRVSKTLYEANINIKAKTTTTTTTTAATVITTTTPK